MRVENTVSILTLESRQDYFNVHTKAEYTEKNRKYACDGLQLNDLKHLSSFAVTLSENGKYFLYSESTETASKLEFTHKNIIY